MTMGSTKSALDSSNAASSISPDIASLIFVCPDQAGIVVQLARFFAEHDLSISSYHELADEGYLFTRLEWYLNDHWPDEAAFINEFDQLAELYAASFEVRFSNRKPSVGLFVGSEKHSFSEFIKRDEVGGSNSALTIPFVIGSDDRVRSIADRYGLPFFYVEVDPSSAESVIAYERKQLDIINRYKPDYLGIVNYDTIISPELIDAIMCPMIKVKRMFMPNFDGKNAFKLAHQQGVKLVGAMAYFVSNQSLYGAIIEQDMTKLNGDISLSGLTQKSCQIEQRVFVKAMTKVLEHKTVIHNKRTISFN